LRACQAVATARCPNCATPPRGIRRRWYRGRILPHLDDRDGCRPGVVPCPVLASVLRGVASGGPAEAHRRARLERPGFPSRGPATPAPASPRGRPSSRGAEPDGTIRRRRGEGLDDPAGPPPAGRRRVTDRRADDEYGFTGRVPLDRARSRLAAQPGGGGTRPGNVVAGARRDPRDRSVRFPPAPGDRSTHRTHPETVRILRILPPRLA